MTNAMLHKQSRQDIDIFFVAIHLDSLLLYTTKKFLLSYAHEVRIIEKRQSL